MNFYSQEIDKSLFEPNINLMRINKNESPFSQRDELDSNNTNELLYQEAKNIYKTQMNKYNTRYVKLDNKKKCQIQKKHRS